MQFRVILKIAGLLLVLFSISMLPPILLSIWYRDGEFSVFLWTMLSILLSGLLLWLPLRKHDRDMRLRDGFIIIVIFWAGLGLAGAIPLLLATSLHMSFTDAAFESISALTTTGATVMNGIDGLPRSILFYRQELQWIGGMGIIILAVAVLPMLGIGGMQLYRAESPGPIKESRLTPRITETARALWYIYLSLTIACALAYYLAGMDLFDAIGHSFSTVSIGGFSTHDGNLGYFNNRLIDAVAVVFMLIAGMNFTLHFLAWRNMKPDVYVSDAETRAFLSVLLCICIISCGYLLYIGFYSQPLTAITNGVFQTVSIATTTGFTAADYHSWPVFLPVLLIFVSFMGACAGSTGGGLKVIRVLLLFKQGVREVRRLIHPNAIINIKLGMGPVEESVINAVWGYFAVYVVAFAVIMLLLMATGLDQISAFSATAAGMNNLGPGLGTVSENYGNLSNVAKWLICLAMLLGRLEIFSLLVLFTPAFWRK